MLPVLVGFSGCFCESNGSYDEYILWNGETVEKICCFERDMIPVCEKATREQKAQAALWFINNSLSWPYAHVKLIGYTVKLKGSRKVKNGLPVVITDYREGHYDSYHRQHVTEKVKINDQWISFSCINEIVKACAPWWA